MINSQVTTVRHQGKEWLCYVPRGMTGEVYEIRRGGDRVVLMVTWSKVFRTTKDLDGDALHCLMVDQIPVEDVEFRTEDQLIN
ncbi:MAG: hypothetical protein OK454_09735 [Thaumarchaeota archaeon]|nr:hypothetical protein [Nitrososphaerota archaeon]